MEYCDNSPIRILTTIHFRLVVFVWLLQSILSTYATPAYIYSPPIDMARVAGTSATFAVKAAGSIPISYQWSFNGGDIDAATSSSYTISHVATSDEGVYSVHVSNAEGDDYAFAELTVIVPPSIVSQPTTNPPPIIDGDNYTFVVDAAGTDPLTYQWRRNGVALPDGTDSSYIATAAGDYTVTVSNDGGSVTSAKATLVVWFPPTITKQPASRTNLVGSTATFSVSIAVGSTKPLSYQWLFDDIEIPGETTNTLTLKNVTSDDAGSYSVYIENSAGDIYSDYADLTVLVPPQVVTQPESLTVNPGDDALFSVTVQDDATWPLDYQWRFNGADITEGGDGPVYYIGNVDSSNAGTYSVRITNPAGFTSSTNVVLTVRQSPTITSAPRDTRVGFGTNVTFSVRATGTAPMIYQWLFNDTPIASATNSVLAFKPTTTNQNGLYSVFISNIVDVVTSTPAILTVIGETVLPTVSVTTPGTAFVTVTNPLLTISGKASDNFAIASVQYQVNGNAYQTADGTRVWSAQIVLSPGTNVIHARSIDSSGNMSIIATRTVFYSTKSPLTLLTNGLGKVAGVTSSLLEVGRGYTATALPAAKQIFAGWTGNIVTNTSVLRFVMQSNLVLQANFIPDPYPARKGVYNGLFYDTNGVHDFSSGYFSLTLADKGICNGKVLIGGSSYNFSNMFTADGKLSFQIVRPPQKPLIFTLNTDPTNVTDIISGTVSSSPWTAGLIADRNPYSKTNVNPRMGTYDIVIAATGNSSGPAGDGFAIVNVDALGNVKVAGALADGTAISQGTTMSKDGDWPFYVPLYAKKGVILSWLTFADTNNAAGNAAWFHPVSSTKYYPQGFTNLYSIDGSIFRKFPKGIAAMSLTNGTITLNGGNLLAPITNGVSISANNTFTVTSSNHLVLSLNATNGALTGAFIHPVTKATTTVKGVVIQSANEARGFFLGTNQSGVFRMNSN